MDLFTLNLRLWLFLGSLLPVPDLPAEDARVLPLVVLDLHLDLRGGELGLAAAQDAGPYAPRLLVAVQDLAHAPVAHAELAADHAGPDPGGRHLDDLEADVVGQRPPVDENAAQLVDTTLACATGRYMYINLMSIKVSRSGKVRTLCRRVFRACSLQYLILAPIPVPVSHPFPDHA